MSKDNKWPEDDLLEAAWGLIANSYGGDWELAGKDWRSAAIKWREAYHKTLPKTVSETAETPAKGG